MVALVMNVLVPLRIHLSPFLTAVVLIEAASVPAPGSVRPKQPISSPLMMPGRYFFFCASVPNSFTGMPKSPLDAPQDKYVEAHAAATSSPTIAWLIKSRFVPP